MYDRTIKMFDEPHTPKALSSAVRDGALHKDKFLTFSHHDSYYRQMLGISKLKVESVLEIGPGENFVAAYFRERGMRYDTMDISETSKPTILGKLDDFDAFRYSNSYELVCAFQMLEHSPYERFRSNLLKMAEMSRRYVFISLPYSCFGFRFALNLSFGQNVNKRKEVSLYFPLGKRNRRYREEFKQEFPWAVHYWEIGRKGFPLRRIRADIRAAGLEILDAFHAANPFHYFILAARREGADDRSR